MWLFTKYGFFSIVRKKYSDHDKPFQIRARNRIDLENLKSEILVDEEIIETPNADYRFRLILDQNELIGLMKFFIENIDYANFKSEIYNTRNQKDKLSCYNETWRIMYEYQNNLS